MRRVCSYRLVAWIVLLVTLGTGSLRAGTNAWRKLGPPDGHVSVLAIDPQNSDIVYAASDAGLFVSVNGGDQWSALDPGPPCCITGLAIDPEDSETLYAVRSTPR